MKTVRFVSVHNEEDVLESNLNWYTSQGVPTVLIDNASTDSSREIASAHEGVIDVRLLYTDHFDRKAMFSELTKAIHDHSPEWVVFADADEFYESKISETIPQLIDRAQFDGANVIQFHNMEFWMTPADPQSDNLLERIVHYSYHDSNRYKVFRFEEGVSLVPYRGHAPHYAPGIEKNILAEIGISRHYKLRSLAQGVRKIARIVPEPSDPSFGFHYLAFEPEESNFVVDPDRLTRRVEGDQWNLEKTFDGHRMSSDALQRYLGVDREGLQQFFRNRTEGMRR